MSEQAHDGGVPPSLEATAQADTAMSDTAPGLAPEEALAGPGDSIGRYIVLAELGRGGMGIVYSAFDPDLDRRVALKVLKAKGGDDSLHQRRLLREAQAMAQLSHPNVIAVHDVGQWKGSVFVAMEFIEGETLTQWSKKDRSWEEVLEVLAQAGEGLHAAHQVGIVHRDFKLDNCMLGSDGRVRVLDFGLARAVDRPEPEGGSTESSEDAREVATRLTATGAVMGTPRFMAPEQYFGTDTSHRTDQFSFCVALFLMVYRMPPFDGDSFASLAASVAGGRVQEPSNRHGVPVWLHQAILRGLSRSPDDRWPSMRELLTELDRPATIRSRRRLFVGVAGASLAALLGVAGLEELRSWREAQAAEQRERDAMSRLDELRPRLERLVEGGQVQEAGNVVEAFVRLPEIRSSTAEGRAWLEYAQMLPPDDTDARVQAAANAFAAAEDEELRDDVLLVLIETFMDDRRWDELDAALATLGDARSGDPTVQRAKAVAAFARHDYAAVAQSTDALAPLAEALSHAAPVDLAWGRTRVADIDGDGVQELIAHRQPDRLEIRTLAPDLPVRHTFTLEPFEGFSALPGDNAVLIYRGGSSDAVHTVVDLSGDEAVERLAIAENVQGVASVDTDGDDRLEHYLPVAHYGRTLLRLERRGSTWTTTQAHAPTDELGASVLSALGGDFDGDGKQELAVGIGGWTAYELRILERGPSGNLELVARKRLGAMSSMARLPGSDHDRIVAKADPVPLTARTDEDPPSGPRPKGMYVLEMQDGQLEIVQYLGEGPRGNPRVGDVDGDGLYDLSVSDWNGSWWARGQADGRFTLHWSFKLWPRALVQLDDDPAHEAVVTFGGKDGPTMVLGLGSTRTPARPVVGSTAMPVPESLSTSGGVVQTWSRAETLVAMGLRAEAVNVFNDLASIARDDSTRSRAWLRAASLAEEIGKDDDAVAIYERANALENPSAATLRGAARLLTKLHDFPAAAQLWRRLPDDADAQKAAADLEELDVPLVSVWAEDARLPPQSRVVDPLAVHWAPDGGGLLLHAEAGAGELLRIPVTVTHARVGVEIDVTLLRTEWASGFTVALQRSDAEPICELNVFARNATTDLHRRLWVSGGKAHEWSVEEPTSSAKVKLGCDRTQNSQASHIEVPEPRHRFDEATPFDPGDYDLVFTAVKPQFPGSSFVTNAIVTDVRLRGAAVRTDAKLSTRDQAAFDAAHGRVIPTPDPDFDRTGRDAVWWAVELERAGHSEDAVAQLLAAGPFAESSPQRKALRYLIRQDAGRLLPLFHAALGKGVGTQWVASWHLVGKANPQEPGFAAALTRDLPLLESLGADRPSLAIAYRWRAELHLARAELIRAGSDLQRAFEIELELLAEEDVPEVRQRAVTTAGQLTLLYLRTGDEPAALQWTRRAIEHGVDPKRVRAYMRGLRPVRERSSQEPWRALLEDPS